MVKLDFVIFQDGEALDVRSRIVLQTVTIGVCVTPQDWGRSVPTARRGGWGRTVGHHVMDCRSPWTVESVCATVVVIMASLVRTPAMVCSEKTRKMNCGVNIDRYLTYLMIYFWLPEIGICINNSCECKNQTTGINQGWWGEFCEERSCPGDLEICSGHGECIRASLTCQCQPGWYGSGCQIADCPGEPDCNGRGVCDSSQRTPTCRCDAGYMGFSCESACVNGTVVQQDQSFSCQCDVCYSGPGCDVLCGGHGTCWEGQCTCDKAWWGKDKPCFSKLSCLYI